MLLREKCLVRIFYYSYIYCHFTKCQINRDRVSTGSLLDKENMLSVNQLMAYAKLREMWKATCVPNYPLKVEKLQRCNSGVNTTALMNGRLTESAKSNITNGTYLNDAKKAWNMCPKIIQKCKKTN